MPAHAFICPNGNQVAIEDCLNQCQQPMRCMFLPTLRSVAASLNRNLTGASVTELIAGTRETYLKKMTHYAVDPQSVLYALHGSGKRHGQKTVQSTDGGTVGIGESA